MSQRKAFSPHWGWWIQGGERIALGLDILSVLSPRIRGRFSQSVHDGLGRVQTGLKEGKSLVGAMREAGLALPMEAWCLLEAGERTGRLGESMKEVGTYLQQCEARRRDLLGQAWYPALVGATALVVMGLILFWVVPQMREVSSAMGFGDELPWLTTHIGTIYGGFLGAALGLIAASASLLIVLNRMGRHSHHWGRFQERLLGAIPLCGRIRFQLRQSRILRQLATLLDGGLTLPQALAVAAKGRGSHWETDELDQFRSRLLAGAGFETSVADCALIDSSDAEILQVGQESGQLDIWMSRIAETRANAAEREIIRLTRFLEPAFLLFLSVAVGGLILAYLLPMVRMLEQAGGSFN